jgi:hypothetical protein
MVMAIILTRQMLTVGKPAHPPLWLYWQPPFAINAQKLQINSASHCTYCAELMLIDMPLTNVAYKLSLKSNGSFSGDCAA